MAMQWMKPADGKQVRCPYCINAGEFRIMEARSPGDWFICAGCGHLTLPSDPSFECSCEKCVSLLRMKQQKFTS